jgi:DNA mismatch repair protein MutL
LIESSEEIFDAPPVETLDFNPLMPGTTSQALGVARAVASAQTGRAETGSFVLTPPATPANAVLPFRPEESLTIEPSGPGEMAAVPSDTSPREFVSGEDAAVGSQFAEEGTPSVDPSGGPVLRAHSQFGIVALGQIDNSFIVAADGGALLIIDQHVAHERILFEKVLRQRSEGKVESQRLLLPLVIELTPRQQVILENITPELAACGFEVEPFGRKTVAIKAAPADLPRSDVQKLLNELLEGLERETQTVTLAKLREKIAASVACHAAIKVNMHLEHSKMIWLIDELQKTQYPMSCPHGRPIVLRYEKHEILKAFKRI